MEVLRAEGIAKRFGRRVVLDDVELRVDAGECIALVGENGTGKSTLLRVCAGLITPDRGRVAVVGRCGYCPQAAGLFELLTADEHVVLFGSAAGLGKADALAQGTTLLDELGLGDRDQQVRHLSGGSRQKLNLALALLGERSVLLLDEPYQGFDHGTYVNFWEHVDGWRAQGKAVIVVTHLLAELTRVDRVVELHGGRTT
ncbi:MAG: ABC transporter ATP-binding protein [Acidimicrobiales bacterium]